MLLNLLWDFDSLVDYWWVQELAINTDAYDTTSTYLYKKRGGKLYFGPLWDFDAVAWGSAEYYGDRVEGFNNTFFIWINRLKEDPEFLQAIHDRWPAIDAELEEVIKPGARLRAPARLTGRRSRNTETGSSPGEPGLMKI